jgi:Fe-S oxidoreductase
MYALLAPTLAAAGFGVYRRVRPWLVGRPLQRWDQPGRRILHFLRHAVLQQRNFRDRVAGFVHAMIFWGFLALAAATTVVFIDHDFRIPIMRGAFYLYFQSLFVDLMGLAFLAGVAISAWRRWKTRPRRLVFHWEASLMLVLLFTLGLTGFLVEGWRIAATADPWGAWSPVGYVVGRLSRPLWSDETLRSMHRAAWWLHLGVAFGFLAWAPYTKMAHALFAPLNVYTADLGPIGASLKPVDFDAAESFGVNSLAQFTWKDLLDLDACTECGRCTASCPANVAGKTLSPRDLILDLQAVLRARTPDAPLVNATPALSPEALWSCTTCAACVESCPVSIEQLPKIVDLRRHLVMEQAEFPQTMKDALDSIESRGHPFRGTQATRLDWADGLDLPEWKEGETYDLLFWVGCAGALVERNQRAVRATARLLKAAGVRFAVLGREETCTGDLARRIGNEFLFETAAKENVQRLMARGVAKIATACPHCFNTLRNEYPRYGGRFEVRHHSEVLAELLRTDRLRPRKKLAASAAFHDPCYLGRHNGQYDAPREVVLAATGRSPVELPRSREKSFCCGGGGGMSFVEEPAGRRVSHRRADEALASGADALAVACPFCTTMLEDAVQARRGEKTMKVRDVAELLWEAMDDAPPA